MEWLGSSKYGSHEALTREAAPPGHPAAKCAAALGARSILARLTKKTEMDGFIFHKRFYLARERLFFPAFAYDCRLKGCGRAMGFYPLEKNFSRGFHQPGILSRRARRLRR